MNKEVLEFHKNSRSKDGHACYCKICAKTQNTLWAMANPEKRKRNQENYFQKKKDVLNENRKQRMGNLKQRLRIRGFTIESFEQELLDQNNRCLICSREFTENLKPVIDHCHKNGHTRGILCCRCNIGIGYIEIPGFLEKALLYIEKTKHL
jgi:hypothetical protein